MRFLLSRLAFWWAALAVGLCLALPAPQGSWVAALAVVAAALSLLMGRGARPAGRANAGGAAAHAHDLAEALHGAARILFQPLGADGLITGRLDEAGAPLQFDRFADPSSDRLLERVVKAFDNSATRLIPQLREGARCADLAGIRQVARTLRPASASVGAVKLSHLCTKIETRDGAEDAALSHHVKLMIEEIDLVLSVLRSLPVPRT